MADYSNYQSPLSGRYASPEMKFLFSNVNRFSMWRHIWFWLAETQKELGLDISDGALKDMKDHWTITESEIKRASEIERETRHDVMAHIHAFEESAPQCRGKVHLGATSCLVADGGDMMIMRDALDLLIKKLAICISKLSKFAVEYKNMPCLAYTHGQPAQPTTVGRRACLWITDLLYDLESLEHQQSLLLTRFRGCKGTTGSQASYLSLFHGDHDKVKELDKGVTRKAGFKSAARIVSQVYSRKIDSDILSALASLGATVESIGTDIRLLARDKELEEPFEKKQVGSSAMAYKRNPMRSERMCSLGRFLRTLPQNALSTHASQWFERTLDDSANRRIAISEAFLTADSCLILLDNISSGLVVYPKVIANRLMQELPFMATEEILMKLCEKGASRQEGHEEIRVLSHQSAAVVKQEGKPNDLIDRMKRTQFFAPIHNSLDDILKPENFVGRAPQQVEEFTGPGGEVETALEPYKEAVENAKAAELHV